MDEIRFTVAEIKNLRQMRLEVETGCRSDFHPTSWYTHAMLLTQGKLRLSDTHPDEIWSLQLPDILVDNSVESLPPFDHTDSLGDTWAQFLA